MSAIKKEEAMNATKGEMLCAWAGPVTIIAFAIAWVFFVQWVQPPSPSLNAMEIAAEYQGDNTLRIRIGMMIMMFGGALNTVFAAIIMIYMLRMKGVSPALAYTQFGSGVLNCLFFIIPAQIFGAVAYRPDRLAEITQFGNDLGWLIFDMVNSTTLVELTALGLAVIWDKGVRPIFPRWYGFYVLWTVLLCVPAGFVTYFKSGPFSWAGIFGWYLGASVFCLWYIVTFFVLRKAIKEHRQAIAD